MNTKTTNIRGIIFDLDGVLISTDALHFKAWKSLCDKRGLFFDEKINEKLRGVSREKSLEIIISENLKRGKTAGFEAKELTQMAEEKNTKYREHLQTLTHSDVSDTVRSTLSSLLDRKYRLAVGSSSKNAGFILERLDLLGYFTAVADGNDIKKSKPDPEVFMKAADFSGLLYSECAVVEDASAGIDAAVSAGMLPIAIGHGDAIKNSNSEIVISDISELLNIFK